MNELKNIEYKAQEVEEMMNMLRHAIDYANYVDFDVYEYIEQVREYARLVYGRTADLEWEIHNLAEDKDEEETEE
ncbi:MAG: hypothetical protein Q4A55_00115 [Aerococcus sp.]|nr:hypothetical protein [Aerococcus sp.]